MDENPIIKVETEYEDVKWNVKVENLKEHSKEDSITDHDEIKMKVLAFKEELFVEDGIVPCHTSDNTQEELSPSMSRARYQYSKYQMMEAISTVRNGTPLRKDARMFHVPCNTLRDKLSGRTQEGRKILRDSYLSTETEQKLAEQKMFSCGKMMVQIACGAGEADSIPETSDSCEKLNAEGPSSHSKTSVSPAEILNNDPHASVNHYSEKQTSETAVHLRKLHYVNNSENTIKSVSSIMSSESFDDPSESPNFTNSSSSEEDSLSNIFDNILRDTTTASSLGSSTKSVPNEGKKRKRNPLMWRKERAKMLRNSGQEYQSSSKSGKIVKKRAMGLPCKPNCSLKCSIKFSHETRCNIFEKYWRMGKLQTQRDFLASCIEPLSVKYRRISTQNDPRKPNSAFYLSNREGRFRVCKTFLRNTLGITDRPIRTIIEKKKSGFIPEDKRGRHQNHAKLSEELRNSVKEHINSIPRIESHYLGANTAREFIDGGLTISEMHRNYEEQRLANNRTAATYPVYANIFNAEFNIGFFKPSKDHCDLCEAYKNVAGIDKDNGVESYKLHLEENQLCREEKERDKESDQQNLILATYDLYAVLPTPVGQSSFFYYKSKLNSYNFTVSELKTDHSRCYFWHEGEGNCGSIEIGTCVYKFLEEISNNAHNNVDLTEVIFYSDNCAGKVQNEDIIAMYLYAVHNLKIKSITHKFLIRGHVQDEGDSVHSLIEKAISRAKKVDPIYIPDQYVKIIKNAKKKGDPFSVVEMSHQDFYDLKYLANGTGRNYSKNTKNEMVNLNDVKILRVEKVLEGQFFYKDSYKDGTEWKEVQVWPKLACTRFLNNENMTMTKAYQSKFILSEKKKNDILWLLNTNIIPKYYEDFFHNYF